MSLKDKCTILEFNDLGDERGKLVVIEGNESIPFEIKRASANPYESLTESEMLAKLEKARAHASEGMYRDASEVSRDMRTKYGL